MIFDVNCQSFKIFALVFGFAVTFVANCHAEKNPITPVKQNFNLKMLGDEAEVQLKAFQIDCQRNEEKWNDFKQFAFEQAATFNRKFASLKPNDWWQQSKLAIESPSVEQRAVENANSIAIAPSTLLTRLVINMTPVQYWQISNQTNGLLETGRQRVTQTTLQLQNDFEASLVQLAKSSNSSLTRLINGSRIAMVTEGTMTGDSFVATENVSDDSPSDPYWGYYADCDHWNAEISYSVGD